VILIFISLDGGVRKAKGEVLNGAPYVKANDCQIELGLDIL
jgi:hypothetical protein